MPPGARVFPDSPADAQRWDYLVTTGFLGEKFSVPQLIMAVAVLRARDDSRQQGRGTAAGLARRG